MQYICKEQKMLRCSNDMSHASGCAHTEVTQVTLCSLAIYKTIYSSNDIVCIKVYIAFYS